MRPAETPAPDGGAYAQPTPRVLYVHDDLTAEVCRRLGADSPAVALVRALFGALSRDPERVVVLTVEEQVERVVAQGSPGPFDFALGIGRAGVRVAEALHARTGWFPRIQRVGLTREEDGRGGYRVVSTEATSLTAQLEGVTAAASLAVVDDTVFSGLTMRTVLAALPPEVRARTRAFALRGVAESVPPLAALCPITVGVAAPGRILRDVSFLNATGLVLRVAIRRRGAPALAFFDRPEWIRAWFPGRADEILDLCRRLNALLEAAPDPSTDSRGIR